VSALELNQLIQRKVMNKNKDNNNSKKSQQHFVAGSTFSDYTATFVQRIPKFAFKENQWKKRWKTEHKPLSDRYIQLHLRGDLTVGAVGRWYPEHAILDFDGRDIEFVEQTRGKLGLVETNSMLCSSESKDSYHLLFRPTYNQKPPTLNLLNDSFKGFCKQHGIEGVYPRPTKCARLPFGKIQKCLDFEYAHLEGWSEKLYWFSKLDDFDLGGVPRQQILPLDIPQNQKIPAWREGKELLEIGLQAPSTRHESQFKVLLYLWRNNTPPKTAYEITWSWIKKKHNGFSKDIQRDPRAVREEIKRQVKHIWGKYTAYPDTTHNTYHGYLTKADLYDIFMYSGGSLVKSRFLFNLVRYCYPRRFRDKINVHSDLLVSWSSSSGRERTYLKRLGELEEWGLLRRWNIYEVGVSSKPIKLEWKYRNIDNAILVDNRAPTTIEDTVRACFKVEEIRGLLKNSGMDEGYISRFLASVFSP